MAKELKDHNYFGIDSTIVADSINEFGDRITTFVVTHPRHILAEMNTHRMFSRNSASSRAIPAKEMIRRVREQPFIPIAWQKDHSGMQGNEYITDEKQIEFVTNAWLEARNQAVKFTNILSTGKYYLDAPRSGSVNETIESDILIMDGQVSVTKQICNRLLEPFLWHTAIITTTEYENFFKLRCPQYVLPLAASVDKLFRSWKDVVKHISTLEFQEEGRVRTEDSIKTEEFISNFSTIERLKQNKGMGEIHIMALAESMWDNYNDNQPKLLKAGEYHIPFGDQIDLNKLYRAFPTDYEDFPNGNVYIRDYDDYEELKKKIAIARCARISYGTFEGKEDYEADVKLYDRLLSSQHLSPFEHVAKCMTINEYKCFVNGIADWYSPSGLDDIGKDVTTNFNSKQGLNSLGWCRNFKGFIQERARLDV